VSFRSQLAVLWVTLAVCLAVVVYLAWAIVNPTRTATAAAGATFSSLPTAAVPSAAVPPSPAPAATATTPTASTLPTPSGIEPKTDAREVVRAALEARLKFNGACTGNNVFLSDLASGDGSYGYCILGKDMFAVYALPSEESAQSAAKLASGGGESVVSESQQNGWWLLYTERRG